jgi:hypothetical protein
LKNTLKFLYNKLFVPEPSIRQVKLETNQIFNLFEFVELCTNILAVSGLFYAIAAYFQILSINPIKTAWDVTIGQFSHIYNNSSYDGKLNFWAIFLTAPLTVILSKVIPQRK